MVASNHDTTPVVQHTGTGWPAKNQHAAPTRPQILQRSSSQATMNATHSSTASSRPSALVCRGCCCGSSRKHPEVDFEKQIEDLSSVARVRTLNCVNECARSNIVIVRFDRKRSFWLGEINSDATTLALCGWIDAGGVEPPPPVLEGKIFIPGSSV